MVRVLELLFPLYVYPSNCSTSNNSCAWGPLYSSITSYPNIQFNLIIDPQDGPGPSNTLPDSNYVAAISRVNSFANVKTLGYVASTRGTRPVSEYQTDVNTYQSWGQKNANLAMDGIFIDEASNSASQVSYFTAFSNYIRSRLPNALVVHNPGTTTPQAYFDAMPQDIFVTFENYYSVWKNGDPWTIWTDPVYANTPRQRQAVIFHHFTGSTTDMVNITDSSAEIQAFRYAYVTTASDYNSFSTQWAPFVAAVSGTNAWMAQHPEWYP